MGREAPVSSGAWPEGEGDMARRIRNHDWRDTSLGPIAGWSARLRTLVEMMLTSPQSVGLLCAPDRVMLYNDAAARSFGPKHPAALGRPARETFPETAPVMTALFDRAFAGEPVEIRAQPLDLHGLGSGPTHIYDTYLTPVREADGRVAYVQTVGFDVGPRLRAEAALRGSETRFRTLAETSPLGVGVSSPDGRMLYTNRAFEKVLGYEPGELLGRSAASLYLDPADREGWLARMEETGGLADHEVRLRRKDGAAMWISLNVAPLEFDGEPALIGVTQDVSERRRVENRLRETEMHHRAELERRIAEATTELKASRDLLQATMDASTDMIQVFEAVRDEDGTIVDFNWVLNNHTSEHRYGEVFGETLLTRNPGVVAEGIFDAFRRVTETGVPEGAERRYVHEQFDGWFYQTVVKLNDGVATTTKDIDDWKRAQAEILRLQEEAADDRLRQSEERHRLILESALDYAIFTTDERGLVTSWPPGAQAVFGWSEAEMIGRDVALTFVPEDRATDEARKEREIAGREGAAPNVRWHLRKDGRRIFIEGSTRPLRAGSRDGPQGFIKIGQDVTTRREADQRQLVLVAELQHRTRNLLGVVRSVADKTASGAASFPEFLARFRDRLGALSRINALLSKLEHGERVTFDELIRTELGARGFLDEDRPAAGARRREDRRDDRTGRSGTERSQADQRHPDHHRAPAGHRETDPATAGRREADRTRTAGARAHRSETDPARTDPAQTGPAETAGAETAGAETAPAQADASEAGRMEATDRAQAAGTGASRAEAGPAEAGRAETTGAAAGRPERVVLDGPTGVRLRSATVQTFALAIHELTTNAVKYGALAGEGGRLEVRWRLVPDAAGLPRLRVEWIESGVRDMPPADAAPRGGGYGRELIERALPYQLGARTAYTVGPDGIRCTIDLPLV